MLHALNKTAITFCLSLSFRLSLPLSLPLSFHLLNYFICLSLLPPLLPLLLLLKWMLKWLLSWLLSSSRPQITSSSRHFSYTHFVTGQVPHRELTPGKQRLKSSHRITGISLLYLIRSSLSPINRRRGLYRSWSLYGSWSWSRSWSWSWIQWWRNVRSRNPQARSAVDAEIRLDRSR